MNILILSRGYNLYSTQSLFFAGQKRGHHMRIIDYLECNIVIEQGKPQIYWRGEHLDQVDAIIPRVGSSQTSYGAAIIRQFEMMHVFSAMSSAALLCARSKLWSMQLLSNSGIGIPKTVFTNITQDINPAIDQIGIPMIIKLLKGTHGLGVILAESRNNAEAVIEAFHRLKERVLLQEFIKESSGRDIRAFVVDGEIVGAMKRIAREGEFRSNLHRGGNSIHIKLTAAERETAIKAVALMGLKIAGVDMLQSNRGPLVLEVNPSPGLEGIETTTKVDIAGKIIQFLERGHRNGLRS